MLIIFDVDGTLLGGEAHDWSAFDRALRETLGFVHTPGFFTSMTDVTAEKICEAAALACGTKACGTISETVRQRYLTNLTAAHQANCEAFVARPGAAKLLQALSERPGVTVAIATGDWLPTISFKLTCAGLDLSRFPMATASDGTRRADIIRIAAERAGKTLQNAVYVGDGVWDLRACRELGIPFIGTGARTERLRAHGAETICEHLEIDAFDKMLRLLVASATWKLSANSVAGS